MSNKFTLDHMTDSPQVQAEIRRLLANQDKFYSILQAASPYIYFIYQQTKTLGLPAELALIPIIESEFNPNDQSSNKGARGLWSLMPGTARELGVKVKANYDGRRNIVASTNAALTYFNALGNQFNRNWYLAIAAYDCGPVPVRSAIRRSGSDTFWDLSLPSETKHYVPKLLAIAAIIENPKKYGVELPETANQPYFSELQFKKPVKLSQIAKSSGITLRTLTTLNPDYNHGAALPNKKGIYALLVPANQALVVKQQLASDIA